MAKTEKKASILKKAVGKAADKADEAKTIKEYEAGKKEEEMEMEKGKYSEKAEGKAHEAKESKAYEMGEKESEKEAEEEKKEEDEDEEEDGKGGCGSYGKGGKKGGKYAAKFPFVVHAVKKAKK